MTREEAIDVLKRNYPSACFEDLCKAVDIAIKALSAESEIIRCKDCKHNQGSCCDYSAVYIRPNGYCQWAERREDE